MPNEGHTASRSDWIEAFGQVYPALPGIAQIECPNCGHDDLRIAFTANHLRAERRGTVFFWCANCLEGIWFGRIEIPEGVHILPAELSDAEFRQHIPNFRVVPASAEEDEVLEEG